MVTTPVYTMMISRVLSESLRIIKANYTHLVTLSLFFLPLSFSIITSQLFTVHQKPLIKLLFYILIVHIFAPFATSTITYITYHAFFGETITLFAALKSLTSSFFPLVWTSIVAHVLLFLISLTFLMFVGLILLLVQNLGFVVIDYNSIYFMWFSVVVGVVLVVIMIYFYVDWSLAFVVVVVESKWGFASLTRSSYLVKGMRSVSLLILLIFGTCGAGMVWICSANIYEISGGMYVFITMLGSFFMMMFLLRITAANTVLYNYCKVLHGELTIEVAPGLTHYVNLPSDYEKAVPHADTVFIA